MRFTPQKYIFLFFVSLITIGTLLLSLPFAHAEKNIPFIDLLFTATSATCVTGLVVRNTAESWTLFGKIVILFLIQIGGLGYMLLATLTALLTGRISLKERLILKEAINLQDMSGIAYLLKMIIKVILIFELIGFLVLALLFTMMRGFSVDNLFHALFHSISAFCNAGFSTFVDNLESMKNNPLVIITISLLVILGGLGFVTIVDIISTKNTKKLSLNSKVVIITTLTLIIIATIGILIFEWNNSLYGLDTKDKIFNAFFHAVMPRTAGFNTIKISTMLYPTLFFIMILMFIGGSPGGTAGGVKTSTFVVVLLSALNTIRGRKRLSIYGRDIPDETIRKAFVLICLGLVFISVIFLLLLLIEKKGFLDILFEVFSAFGTVGLSMGITPDLNFIGKLLIIILMFTGRVGTLCLGSMILQEISVEMKYPEENIMVG